MSALSAPKSFSHPKMVAMILRESTSIAMTQSPSATTTYVKIFSKTLYCLVVQPSLKAWESVCGKSCISWLHQQIKLRFWPHLSVNTQCGSVVPSSHLSPLSRQCGSISKSMTRMVPRLFTESASEKGIFFIIYDKVYSLQRDNIYFNLHLPLPS